ANIVTFGSPSSSPTASIADASPSIDASNAPSISPIPSPTPLPPPVALYAACDDLDETVPLALRVDYFSGTGRQWLISVYEDGHVLTPDLKLVAVSSPLDVIDGAWMLARRLTPAGIAQLRETVTATGPFGTSGSYNPVALPNVEPPGRDGNGYGISLGSGTDAVTVHWASMFPDDALYYEPSPEREALDALGAKMLVFDSWLPDDAWAERDPCTVQALRFRVFIFADLYGGALAELPPDVADVPWPLGGEILSWGADVGSPDEPYPIVRCGIAARADASRLVDELREGGAFEPYFTTLDAGPGVGLQLGDRAANRILDIIVQPLLPDDDQCTESNLEGITLPVAQP
ncbi:MAG: hypothetical protein OEW24_07025, partial [Chloroflexota bacterium]|nr:hypothetical protein [Chloroflexota bacterium]